MISHIKKHAVIYTQILASLSTSLIFIFILFPFLTRFISLDPIPHIIKLDQEQMEKLAPKTIVKTGLYIKDFSEFDMLNNKFKLEAVLSFEYNPQEVTEEELSKFHFERGQITYRSAPAKRKIGKSELLYYSIMVEFDNEMNYERFPLDDHQLHIVFQNHRLSPQDVVFVSNNNRFIVQASRHIEAWKGINTFATSGYVEEILERIEKPQTTIQYPRIVFSIDYSRYSLRPLFMVLLPLLAIFLILIFSLIPISPTMYSTRVHMLVGATTALVVYLFAMTPSSPKVGYMMFSDYIYIYVLVATVVIFGISLACKSLSVYSRMIINFIANLGLLGLWSYLLYM